MKKGVLVALVGVIWLGITYFILDHLISKSCYIKTRAITWTIKPHAFVDFPPIHGQANFIQKNLNASIDAYGFLSDSVITRVLKDEMLGRCVLLNADSTYYEVMCMNELEGGDGSYVATPDTIYRVEYRPVIIEREKPSE